MDTKNLFPKFSLYDYVISHFISHDDFQPKLQQAYLQNGYVYASNGHLVIRVDNVLCAKQYTNDSTAPDFEKVFNEKLKDSERKGTLTIDELLPCMEYIQVKVRKAKEECEECDGDGTKECEHCGNTYDCKDCNGTGTIENDTNRLIREVDFVNDSDRIMYVNIAGVNFSPSYLELIMWCMLALKTERCNFATFVVGGIFEFANIQIIVMGRS